MKHDPPGYLHGEPMPITRANVRDELMDLIATEHHPVDVAAQLVEWLVPQDQGRRIQVALDALNRVMLALEEEAGGSDPRLVPLTQAYDALGRLLE